VLADDYLLEFHRDGAMTWEDYHRRAVRLTGERMFRIVRHPEMRPLLDQVPEVLRRPQFVCQSTIDEGVYPQYQWYAVTVVGPKWLCVVVKDLREDAFVITASVTDKPKKGRLIYG